MQRQTAYLEALGSLPKLQSHFGHYLEKPKQCRQCGEQWMDYEEKMTDVNIAMQLLADAYDDRFNTALLISADSDLTTPVNVVRAKFPGKNIIVALPPNRRSHQLTQAASGSFIMAVALPRRDGGAGVELVALEGAFTGMPTAVFYAVEGLAAFQSPERLYGRAAIAAYVDGTEGRLMRSMKSILGSTLVERATEVGGRPPGALPRRDRRLSAASEVARRKPRRPGHDRAVIGRPVFFVDDEPERDAAAQSALERVAREVGFAEVQFQYEPIAAAFDHEQTVSREQVVMVADIGCANASISTPPIR